MLELKDICKTFNPNTINAKVALNHLNLTLNDGDFVTVIGGNGAGKSTMLNAIAGVFQVDSGTITIDGQDVTKLPEHKRAAFLGRVFQDPMMGTAPTMQIEENLALAARRGQPRGLKWGITACGAGRLQGTAADAGSGAGGPPYRQGGPALRRSASGADAADGLPEAAQAAAVGRAHRRSGPQDRCTRCWRCPTRSCRRTTSPP